MAGSKSNYLESALLNGVLGGPQFTLPGFVYVALSGALYSDTATGGSMTELTAASYARVAVTNNATSWPAAASGSKSNGVSFTYPTAGEDWGIVRSFYICDAASGGNVLYGGDLVTEREIRLGDTASFAVGAVTVTED